MDRAEIIKLLSQMVSENRLKTFNYVLSNRTRYITVVLEDLFQSHNASAVIRSCDCFGIQDVHMIENSFKYSANPDVAVGSAQWLNIIKHNHTKDNTIDAIEKLKKNGYRIVATTPHTNDTQLHNLNLENGKIALLFGAELTGLSKTAMKIADEYVKIPMKGFTESFNISVSAAICLYNLTQRLHNSDIDWKLSKNEADEILEKWLRISVKDSNNIIKLTSNRAKRSL